MPLALTTVARIVVGIVHMHAFLQSGLRAAGQRVASSIVGCVDARDALVVRPSGVETAAAVTVGSASSRVAQTASSVKYTCPA